MLVEEILENGVELMTHIYED